MKAIHYRGSIEHIEEIHGVFENYRGNLKDVLGDTEVYYTRTFDLGLGNTVTDYGSWSSFILVCNDYEDFKKGDMLII